MSRILCDIMNSSIGKDFALMGGSAIVFLYRNMYRFSTDLDLDFIGNKNLGIKGEAEIIARQKFDKKILEQIANSYNLKLKPKKQNTKKKEIRFIQYELYYNSFYTRTGILELDISYRYCHSILNTSHISWPFSFPKEFLRLKYKHSDKRNCMLVKLLPW